MKKGCYCQSCSMPISDPELRGTEADGSKSTEYCKFCYQRGQFTNPNLTLDEMKNRMMAKKYTTIVFEQVIQEALKRLPRLKRWQKA